MEPRVFSSTDFELLGVERHGGMAKVRKARLSETRELCALKYSAEGNHDSLATTSFNREFTALGNMEHKSIVRMLGVGTDGATRFIALEWLDETLVDRIQDIGPMNWDSFYELIGRPLLEGIQYAHSRKYVHRDLKPLNVMFNHLGMPKITDFGIARNLGDVRLGHTFMRAGSHPWTPAEADDGMDSERRDLYSWGAICVACLTGRLDYKLVSELHSAVVRLGENAPRQILESCLADVPANRPVSAISLLWDLDDFHKRRLEKTDIVRTIGVDVAPHVHKLMEDLLPDVADPIHRIVQLFEDFSDPCNISSGSENDLEFLGKTFYIRGGRVSNVSPWLLIKDVRPATTLSSFTPGCHALINFVERKDPKADPTQSRANIAFLDDYLQSYQERAREEERRRDEERYLAMLQDVVGSRMRALRHLPALEYSDGKWEGGEFTVIIDGDEFPATDEQRIIRANGAVLVFEVVRIAQGRVFLRPVGPRRTQPAPEGLLQVDTLAQRRALERQDEAVRTLRSDLAVSPSLKRVILKPSTSSIPEIGGRPESEGLSPDKTMVLDAALGLRQLMVVQGPPGTGKTKLITEVVKRYLQENPNARVLIAAQTHIAIDHVIEKLLQLQETSGRVVRIARTGEDKVSEKVREALLQNCLRRWCQSAADASRQFMRERGKRMQFNAADVELSIRLEALVLGCEHVRRLKDTLSIEQNELAQAQNDAIAAQESEVADIETATVALMTLEELEVERKRLSEHVQRLRDELRALSPDGAQLADLDEEGLRDWSSAFRSDDPTWLEFRRELELQVAWLDLLGQLRQFEEVVLRSASVVAGTCVGLGSSEAFTKTQFDLCIIDEASKATATEALVPMVRSERCLIVGDPRQLPPFERNTLDVEGYAEEEVKETLLDYLIPRLPPECVFELRHQHRMCKSIGELISHAFYRKRLINDRPDSERPSWIQKKFPKAVVWIDTQGAPQTKQGHSFINRTEQDVILDLLGKLQYAASRAKIQSSVAVIAGYAAQARALDTRIQRGSHTALSIDVATVDSFQGRESDTCIFSVTLSNTKDYLGFLTSIERLNVALSRPKDLLIIVGDQNFCYEVPGKNPFRAVIDYIEANPDTCETQHASI